MFAVNNMILTRKRNYGKKFMNRRYVWLLKINIMKL